MSIKGTGAIEAVARCTTIGFILILASPPTAYGIDLTAPKVKLQIARERDNPPPVIAYGPLAGFGNTCADLAGVADVLVSSGGTLNGDQSGGTNDFGDAGVTDGADPLGCNEGAGWGSGGLDQILEFTVDATGPWTFTTCPGYSDTGTGGPSGGNGRDTSLMVLEDTGAGCPGNFSVFCNGDGGGNCPGFQSEIINLSLTAGTTYYLLVDAWSAGTSGPFTVAFHGPCADDADCTARDQDVFCNGPETCGADDLCESAGDPCVGTTTPVCDEFDGVCLACFDTPDPAAACGDDGNPCNGIETCDDVSGTCINVNPCPDGFCRNGICQTIGSCDQVGDPCRSDDDCCTFTTCKGCILPGTGSGTPCWDGSPKLGPDQHCPIGEYCVPGGNADVFCERDSCYVYLTDTSGYFAPGTGFQTFQADEMRLAPAPAGRDVISYQLQLVCREQRPPPCAGTGPFDVTTELWTAVGSDPLVDPNAGLPDAPIPGTTCTFQDVPCGGGGPIGTPGRTITTVLECAPNGGAPTGALLIDEVAAGIDNWMLYTASTGCQGISVAGGRPLSQGVIVGATGFNFWTDSNGLPPLHGGVGWLLTTFGPTPFDSHFGNANVCTAVVGPCCLGVGGCEMLTETACAEQGGRFIGVNDALNPNNTCIDTGDADGIADLCDNCPNADNPEQRDCNNDGEGDACEADETDQDRDLDGVCNDVDGCPDDPFKSEPGDGFHQAPGFCGCGCQDPDDDVDGVADCSRCCSRADNCFDADKCPNDPYKVDPGTCGCGVADMGDEDGDGVLDCLDQCRGADDAIFAPECAVAIPAMTEWGLVILALLMLTVAKAASYSRRSTRATLVFLLAAPLTAYGIDLTAPRSKLQIARERDTPQPVVSYGPPAGFGNTCADLAGGADVLVSSGGTLNGDQSAGTNDFGDAGVTNGADPGGCNEGAGWGSGGLDQIIEFTVDTTGPWTFTTCPGYSDAGTGGPSGGSGLDTSLIVLEDTGAGCPGNFSVACNGDGGGNCPGIQSEIINLTLTAGTTYYLLVDAWSASTSGPFTVAYHGPCADDADCTARDQDVFCNGVESCGADGLCTSAGDPCRGTAQPLCDEGNRRCLACNEAPDPNAACGDDGDPCNGVEICNTATNGCNTVRACPDGLCQNGTCQETGACDQTGDPCRRDEDCPLFTSGQTCTLSGAGSGTTCFDGRVAIGPNDDCPAGESCVPNPGGNADVFCDRDSCFVYRTDNSGYFGPGQGFQTFAADDMKLGAAPAGRDVISYQLQLVCREQRPPPCAGTGPFDVTTELWTAVGTDPMVDPNAGLPDAFIPGTRCVFKGVACGVGGPVGTPGRTTLTALTCTAANGLTGGTLIDSVPAGIDDWMLYTASTGCQGFSISGTTPLSQGVIIGATGFCLFGDSNGLPPGQGGVGWLVGGCKFSSSPFEANFGNANVCTAVVGPCCLGVAGCEMLTETACAEQGGRFIGVNDALNPNNTCNETGDADGIADLCDNCPNADNPEQRDCNNDGDGDACEADENEQDSDLDGVCNGVDGCPDDPDKSEPGDGLNQAPGDCGCGCEDFDDDLDGVADCHGCCSRADDCLDADKCRGDPNKVDPGTCGCGVADVGDEDGDGVLDCLDQCRGVDDAIFAPECAVAIPAMGEWGLVILVLLLLTAAKAASFASRETTQQRKPR